MAEVVTATPPKRPEVNDFQFYCSFETFELIVNWFLYAVSIICIRTLELQVRNGKTIIDNSPPSSYILKTLKS